MGVGVRHQREKAVRAAAQDGSPEPAPDPPPGNHLRGTWRGGAQTHPRTKPGGSGSAQNFRQGAEALIAAPLIVTAFSAALFGGLLSPAITYGFERMSEYEIKWPEFTRKTSSKSGKSRALQFSWLDTLEAIGKIVSKLESVQSETAYAK